MGVKGFVQLGVPHLSHDQPKSQREGSEDLQRGCEGLFSDNLGKSKVRYLDRKLLVDQQDVLWLDISVDNASLMLGRLSYVPTELLGRRTK